MTDLAFGANIGDWLATVNGSGRAAYRRSTGNDPALAQRIIVERPGLFGDSYAVDPAKRAQVTDPREQGLLADIDSRTKQSTLGKIAVLPVIMLVCYLVLIAYFKAKGGYKAEHLVAEGARTG